MRLIRTLLLALLAGALGGYIWLVEKPRIALEGEPDQLLTFDPEHASRLRLAAPQTPALTLEKIDDAWKITEPIRADADDEAVLRLLEQIAKTEAVRRIALKEAEPLATYGLDGDGSQARVSLALDDGRTLPDIVIGNTTPVGYEAFARIEGREEIVLVPLLLHSGIKKSVFDLREKQMFTVNPRDALNAKISTAGGTIALKREGDRWQITEPISSPADPAQVESLVGALNEITALAFYEGPDLQREAFGLTEPSLTFQAEVGEAGVVGFKLGAQSSDPPAGYYLERLGDGQVVKAPEWARTRFAKDIGVLRDKRLFDCDAKQVGKITYERSDDASFSILLGEDGSWRMEPAPERTLQDPVIERARSGLATLAGTEVAAEKADTVEKLAGFGLDVPVVEVELTTTDGRPCGRAAAGIVGPESESPAYYLKRSDSSLVLSAPAYVFSRMNMVASDFLAPETPPAGAAPQATP